VSSGAPLRLTVLVDQYPALSETFVVSEVHALSALGHDVCVETASWARRRGPWREGVPVASLDDDGLVRRLTDLAWLVARHPLGVARDLFARLRWRREEYVRPWRVLAPLARRISRRRPDHLHVHFAAGAALDTMRIGDLLGLPYSVTAHAYEIFRDPANLAEKLERSAFVTTGCRYNVDHLRGLVSPAAADRVHEIVMGVDAGRFQRARPLPGGRTILAVGRLVEKKGFGDLVEAAALLRDRAAVGRVVIVGEGDERDGLVARIERLGLGDLVELAGARDPDEIRTLLEEADVLAVPCVISRDGDRDSMPVVIKEAMAMEVMVVGTDVAGLPEAISSEWGRLVPPSSPAALADALAELLALPLAERAAMGARARAWVIEHANVEIETAKLAGLIEASLAERG
jgi:glycosyltransferase involved in cell wall biosynthesis